MSSATAAPRYAPKDPTLPKPWRGLVDGKTGYLYFWNPETNVTQYERPVAPSRTGSVPPQKSSAATISSLVQVQPSSLGKHRGSGYDDDNRYSRSSNAMSKLASGTRSYQSGKRGSDHSYNVPNEEVGAGHGVSTGRGHEPSDLGTGPSSESYRRRHEISVTGDNVPPPFTSFQDTGFPQEILREVRYLLLGGAKCRTLCPPSFVGVDACIWSALTRRTNFEKGFPNHPSSWRRLPLVMIQSATWSEQKKGPPPALACISKHCLLQVGDEAASCITTNRMRVQKDTNQKS